MSWKLHAAQKIIYDTVRRQPKEIKEVVCLCSRRFGKSYLGVLMAIQDCLRNPGVYVRIIGPEISQTINIVEPLIDKIVRDAPAGLIRRKASEHRWKVGESWLVVGGFDNKNIQKHLGQEAFAFYIEETGSSNSDDYTYAQREVLSPQLLHSRGRRIHLTTPPVDPSHPFVTEIIPKAKLNNVYFEYTLYDNPLLTPEQMQEAVVESGGVETEAFRRNYLCEIIRDSRLTIIPEFNRDVHVQNFDPPGYANWIMSVDFGGIRDKTVAVLMYHDFLKATDCVWDERVFDVNTSTSEIVQGIREMEALLPAGHTISARYGDSSGQTQVDCNIEHDFVLTLPYKQDLDAAVNVVRVLFTQEKLLIHKRCAFLALTLESSMFNKNRTDFARSEALGHFDAGMALVYGVRMLDRVSDPFPSKTFNYRYQMPSRTIAHTTDLQEVGRAISGKKFGAFK